MHAKPPQQRATMGVTPRPGLAHRSAAATPNRHRRRLPVPTTRSTIVRSTCEAPDCDRPPRRQNRLCSAHAHQRRQGQPFHKPFTLLTTVERFWAKVNKDGPTMAHMETPCWVWTASVREGYGCFHGFGQQRAHRVAWAMVESVPADMYVCHRCDNRACVRRDHLFLGTHLDNINDKVAKGRQARGYRPPNAILNPAAVVAIRQEYASGNIGQQALAEKYGVSRPTISAIMTGRLWRTDAGRAALAGDVAVAS